MKIKVLNPMGSLQYGEICDAIENPINRENVVVFDSNGSSWHLYAGNFQRVEESNFQGSTELKATTIRDLIGQDLARIEFR